MVILEDAKLGTVPEEVLGYNCLPRLRDYFRSLRHGAAERRAAKLFLLGNGGVGKTQIGRRLRGEAYDPSLPTTHGIDVHHTALAAAGGPLALGLWDFGGQPLYHGTHALFLRGGSLYLLVWAPEHEEGMHDDGLGMHHERLPLPYWAGLARQAGGEGSALLIVETRVDIAGTARLAPPIAEDALAWCGFRRVLDVSALKGRGFDELGGAIAAAAEWMLGRRGQQKISLAWVRVIEAIAALRGTVKTLSRPEFESLCRKHKVTEGFDTLLHYLNATGELFHRPGLFGDAVVIDQNWMLDAVYTLFERKDVAGRLREAQGRFRRADLGDWLWNEAGHGEEEQELFVSWMLACDLCFAQDRLPWGETVYVAPSALPGWPDMRTTEARKWREEWPTTVSGAYDVPLLNDGIVHALIARIGREMRLDAEYWRMGVKIVDPATGVRLRVRCERAASVWSGAVVIEAQHPSETSPHRAVELLAAAQRLVEEVLSDAGLPAVPREGAPVRFEHRDGEEAQGLGELLDVAPLPGPPQETAPLPTAAQMALALGIGRDLNRLREPEVAVLCVMLAIPLHDRPRDTITLGRQCKEILLWSQDEQRLPDLRDALDMLLANA